jgi:hypothetical protein
LLLRLKGKRAFSLMKGLFGSYFPVVRGASIEPPEFNLTTSTLFGTGNNV